MLGSLSQRLSGRTSPYDLLPTTHSDRSHHGHSSSSPSSPSPSPGFRRVNGPKQPALWFCTKPLLRLLVLAVVCVGTVHLFWGVDSLVGGWVEAEVHSKPPLYERYYQAELRMPQHDPDLPPPEGTHGQYIWYANHVHASGWGNAMQEHLLNAHLAHESGRAFVYSNYTWNKNGQDYTDFNGHLIPSRIPISALLSGPAAGGPWPPGDPAPRAVVKEYWDQICPEPEVIKSEELFSMHAEEDAGVIHQTWVDKLQTMGRCVEIHEESIQIWSIWVFGSKRILGIWDSLKTSPVITQFRWSNLIERGYLANRHLLTKTSWLTDLVRRPTAYPYTPIPGLLVLHVRRGDFEEHCLHFARWQSQWNGFNQFPELPDHFEPPPPKSWGEYTEEGRQVYLRHCFPSIEQIVDRVAEVRASAAGKGLKDVYIMTNGKRPWVAELKEALWKLGGWEQVTSSRDLKLDWEQQYVAQSVDMLIGQRAQVLIGNGFSSLTSNIVMLRMAQDFPPDSNRFW